MTLPSWAFGAVAVVGRVVSTAVRAAGRVFVGRPGERTLFTEVFAGGRRDRGPGVGVGAGVGRQRATRGVGGK